MTPAEYNWHLPAPGDYARSWRKLNEIVARDPDQVVRVPGWIVGSRGDASEPASKVLRCLRSALDNRINARAGVVLADPREGESAHRRDAIQSREINTRRLRVYQFETRAARRRLGHMLARHDD